MPAIDQFAGAGHNILAPFADAAAVTPDDNADLTFATRGLMVGAAGDVAVQMLKTKAVVTLRALQPGTVYPIRVSRVMAAGTTATNIVGLT